MHWAPDPVSAAVPVLAHQGGWDEMLFVLVPIVLFAALLGVANRRAARQQADRERVSPAEPE